MPKPARTRPVSAAQVRAYAGKAQEYVDAAVSEIEAERLKQSILQRLFDAAWRDLLVEVEDGKQAAMARNARWFCQTDAQGKAPDPIVRDLVGLCL